MLPTDHEISAKITMLALVRLSPVPHAVMDNKAISTLSSLYDYVALYVIRMKFRAQKKSLSNLLLKCIDQVVSVTYRYVPVYANEI